MSDALEVESQAAVRTWALESKPRPSARAASALKHRATFPDLVKLGTTSYSVSQASVELGHSPASVSPVAGTKRHLEVWLIKMASKHCFSFLSIFMGVSCGCISGRHTQRGCVLMGMVT